MASQLGYDVFVRRVISATVAVFSLFAASVLFVSSSHAQINGAPASVTSPGFGGRAINGPRASVTSLGPNGYAPGRGEFFSGFGDNGSRSQHHQSESNSRVGDNEVRSRHHHFVPYLPTVVYEVPLPYAVDIGASEDEATDDAEEPESNYQGGPTVFDRRGYGAASYVPVPHDAPRAHPAERAERSEEPAPAPETLDPTTLVFKDGHKLEVGNYAIIGQTLFDMTPGHARKVPLKELDLEATRRVNDDHGVTFQLPLSSQAN